MSSWTAIEIDGMKIVENQNHFDEWYFNKENRVIEMVFCTSYYGDPTWEPKEEQIKTYQYRMSALVLRRRLNLAGYNIENLEQEFSQQLNQQIKDADEMIKHAPIGDAARFLPVLKSSTLADWIKRLKVIHEKKLKVSYFNSEKTEYDDELLTLMLLGDVFFSDSPTAGYFNFPCLTIEGYATALLEFLPDSAECVQDVTELIHAGWSEEFEDLEEYQQEFTKFYKVFQTSVRDTAALMELDKKNSVLARILYASVITAMETYLADTFKKQVLNRPSIQRRFVRNHDVFKEKKITISSILDRIGMLKDEISSEIDKISFHNLDKIPGLYKAVLDTDFPKNKMANLHEAIRNRHDIVHRNGKSTLGHCLEVSMTDVETLIVLVNDVLKHIDKQIKDGLLDNGSV